MGNTPYREMLGAQNVLPEFGCVNSGNPVNVVGKNRTRRFNGCYDVIIRIMLRDINYGW